MPTRIRPVLGLLLLVAASGCGERLAEVRGTVTYKGRPLEVRRCQIAFMSDEQKVFIAATLEDDGTYRVSMADGYGLPPGRYKVAFIFPPDYNPAKNRNHEEAEQLADSMIPRKFRSAQTSGLVLELSSQGAQFNVEMDEAKKG